MHNMLMLCKTLAILTPVLAAVLSAATCVAGDRGDTVEHETRVADEPPISASAIPPAGVPAPPSAVNP